MRTILILFTVFLASCFSRPANAQFHTYTGPVIGNYETSSSWSPSGPPGANGSANFMQNQTSIVQFNSNPTNNLLNVANGGYIFRPDSFDRTYSLSGTSQVDNGGGLRLSSSPFGGRMQLNLGGLFYVGRTGVGTFEAISSDIISGDGLGTRIGENMGSNGTVTLADANWTHQGFFFMVGSGGRGTLNVIGGSRLDVHQFVLGATGNGTANIDGAGSRLDAQLGMQIGESGNGTMVISNGGLVVSSQTARLGISASGNGSVNVTGNGSWNHFSTTLEVGELGRGNLNITDGGTVRSQGLTLGGGSSGVGTMDVSGVGSSFSTSFNGAIVRIGSDDGGIGIMNIGTGGSVFASRLQLGNNGTLVIDGGSLRTGSRGLEASNLGQIRFQSGTLHINSSLDSSYFSALGNSIDLTPDKSLIVGRTLHVSSKDRLSLSGGNLSADELQLNSGIISGTGTLDLRNMIEDNRLTGTGIVSTSISGNADSVIDSTGDLALGNLSSSAGFEFGGMLNVGRNTVILHDSNNAILGRNTILNGGRLVSINGIELHAGNQLTTRSTAGENSLIDGAFTNNGIVNGATTLGEYLIFTDDVDGAGSYTGNVLFSDAFNPGNSPGVVSLENILLDSSSTLGIELAGIDFGLFDMLDISGDAMLEGSLDVSLINGFQLDAGQEFLILDIDGFATGTFSGFGEGDLIGNFGGRDLFISYSAGNGNDVALFTSVPEPNSMTVFTMAFLMASIGYRRKRK